MPIGERTRRWLRRGAVVGGLALAALAVGALAVPRIIAAQVEARVGGRVAFDGWWLNWHSAGVRGLRLHESAATDAPVWARAAWVRTDLSLAGFFTGRFAPTVLAFERPEVTIRLDRSGQPLVTFPERPPGTDRLPVASVANGRLTFAQEGRRELSVGGITGRLTPTPGTSGRTARFEAQAEDPRWGPLTAEGDLAVEPGPSARLAVRAPAVAASAEAAACLPFVPEETWRHVTVIGPVDAALTVQAPMPDGRPPDVLVIVRSAGTAVALPELGLDLSDATGEVRIHNDQVELRSLRGRALDGTAEVSGRLDFAARPPRLNLGLRLRNVDVERTPETWQLQDAGLTGRLSGSAHLRLSLDPDGARLDGSTGQGELTGGTLGDIPFKSLKLAMRAEKDEIVYDTAPADSANPPDDGPAPLDPPDDPPSAGAPSPRPAGPTARNMPAWIVSTLIAMQTPAANPPQGPGTPAPAAAQAPDRPKSPGFVMPKSIRTQMEFDDLDLDPLIARAQALGIVLPFVASGRLSVKANATIPLGRLRELRGYAFHGSVTLTGGTVAGIDLGRVTAELDLSDGVLELRRIAGVLVERVQGGLLAHPPAAPDFGDGDPLAPGAFRGRLRAELEPRGRFEAHVEGVDLPISELIAPYVPPPAPVTGRVTGTVDVIGDLAHADDPEAWQAGGHLTAERVTYRGTALDTVATDATVAGGTLTVGKFTATLAGRPLALDGRLALTPPHEFDARLRIDDWDLARLLALVPRLPESLRGMAGRVALRAQGRGTAKPWAVITDGEGRVARLQAAGVALGDVPLKWSTTEAGIVVAIPEARPLGAGFRAQATIPDRGAGPITGRAELRGLDTAKLAALVPGAGLPMTGRADGQATFTVSRDPAGGSPAVAAQARFQAPGLTLRGVPVTAVVATAELKQGTVRYELAGDGLDGRFRLAGSGPIPPSGPLDSHAQAVGFSLRPELWRALELGALEPLEGQGAINTNVRLNPGGTLGARGFAEVRDLSWGRVLPLGRLRATFAITPGGWEAQPLEGDLFGGTVRASARSEPPPAPPGSVQFRVDVERAELARLLAFEPVLAQGAHGTAALRLAGRLDPGLRVDGELRIDRGELLGLPLSEVRAPITLTYVPASGAGSLDLTRWSARFARGRVQGNIRTRLGQSRGFQTEIELADLDLETLNRALSDAARPSTGKLGGRISLGGTDRATPASYQGRVELTLADAALGDVPILRALDRFLGGASGGVFERGQLRGVLNGRGLEIEECGLQGRILQLHAEGTIAYNQDLDLVVLVNTNQIIPQTGNALLALIPGLNQVRGSEATLQVANFLSSRLLKFRVTGTLRNPSVNLDPTVTVTNAAVGFFAGALRLPLGLLK